MIGIGIGIGLMRGNGVGPISLFGSGETGFLYETTYGGSTPDAGDAVGTITDRTTNGNDATQGSGTLQPLYRISPIRSQWDGSNDFMDTGFNATAAGTIAARVYVPADHTGTTVIIGSGADAVSGRCYLAIDSNGKASGSIGNDAVGTIFGGSDLTGSTATLVLSWDGTTVRLYVDGVEVYSDPQDGIIDDDLPFYIGANNKVSVGAVAPFKGEIARFLGIDRALTALDVERLSASWSSIEIIPWVLSLGAWNDAGIWRDDYTWKDAA